jgi:hypothetical protein
VPYKKCEVPVFLYHLTDFEIGHNKVCFGLGVNTKVEEPDSFPHQSRPVRVISAGWFPPTMQYASFMSSNGFENKVYSSHSP